MSPIQIGLDARTFSTSLQHRLEFYRRHLVAGAPIPVHELLDTDALPARRGAARDALWQRQALAPVDTSEWISKGALVDLVLRYHLWQGTNLLRLDCTVKGDLRLHPSLSGGSLTVTVGSELEMRVRDSVLVNGQVVRFKDAMLLKRLVFDPTMLSYDFCLPGESHPYLVIRAVYANNAEDFHSNIRILPFDAKTRLSFALRESVTAQDCGSPRNKEEHTLWRRSNQEGICYTSAGCGTDVQPRSPGDINLGCYPSYADAEEAMRTHPDCYHSFAEDLDDKA